MKSVSSTAPADWVDFEGKVFNNESTFDRAYRIQKISETVTWRKSNGLTNWAIERLLKGVKWMRLMWLECLYACRLNNLSVGWSDSVLVNRSNEWLIWIESDVTSFSCRPFQYFCSQSAKRLMMIRRKRCWNGSWDDSKFYAGF